uniref:Proliferation-associated 2G4, b n=1 Tax=Mastacembelus armatus TaxID=205130 RepID=A0A7N8X8X5_9TELE
MSGDDETQEQTIADDLVVTKYKMGAEIANQALKTVVAAATAGTSVLSLCEKGDAFIMAETGKIFKKEKDMKKGIAFPTCVSVNNCVCHYSPLKSDPDVILKDGDLVKIDLGVHVDGFISNVAHSFVVGVTKDNPLTGRKADVIKAAHLCAEAALRLVKPGSQNTQVTEAWNKIAKSFKCSPIEGMLSHQLKQHVIDGEKTIIQNPTDQQKKDHEKAEFEVNLFLLSSPYFSFLLGVVECAKHELLQPFSVLHEKEGEFVAQFKFTVLLMANGPLRITNSLFEPELYKSEHEVEDAELKALLQSSASRKTQKKKKKKVSYRAVWLMR